MFSLNREFKEESFPGIFSILNFFSTDDILDLHEYATHKFKQKGTTFGDNVNQQEYTPPYISYSTDTNNKETKQERDSNVVWVYPKNQKTKNIYKKIINKVLDVNENEFKFKLTDIETLQYTIYEEGQYYKKHIDFGNELLVGNAQRKLSFSIQLTDPSEYEGGDLCGYVNEVPIVAEKALGSISFFSSFMLHEVTPVTKGKRVSLVGWVNGPRFE